MSRYSCRNTLCRIFRLTFLQCRRTRIALHPLKCLKKGPVTPVWAGCRTSTLHCIDHKIVSRYRGVAISRITAVKFARKQPVFPHGKRNNLFQAPKQPFPFFSHGKKKHTSFKAPFSPFLGTSNRVCFKEQQKRSERIEINNAASMLQRGAQKVLFADILPKKIHGSS